MGLRTRFEPGSPSREGHRRASCGAQAADTSRPRLDWAIFVNSIPKWVHRQSINAIYRVVHSGDSTSLAGRVERCVGINSFIAENIREGIVVRWCVLFLGYYRSNRYQ